MHLTSGSLAVDVQIVKDENPVLNVDASNVWDWDQQLYRFLTHYPTEVIPLFDNHANHLATTMKAPLGLEHIEYSCLVRLLLD